METQVDITINFEFLQDLPEDTTHVVMEGSTRSGKTWSILQWLVLQCLQNDEYVVRCFRYHAVDNAKTLVPDFLAVLKQYGIHEIVNWNKSSNTCTFPNGSILHFCATENIDVLHGMKQNIAFIDEAMQLRSEAYTQIAYRTTDLIVFAFNPSINTHWIFDRIIPLDTCAYKHSTYKDNPFLTAAQIKEIESYDPNNPENIRLGTADAFLWAVYGEGKRGKLEGAIYPLFQPLNYSEFPDRRLCQAWGYSMDFGFVDPTAMVECRLHNGDLYIKEVFCEPGLITISNPNDPGVPSIQQQLEQHDIDKRTMIICDCAASQDIAALRSLGYSVIPQTVKHVLPGINKVKEHRLFLDNDSPNLLEAIQRYTWKRSSQGVWLQDPEHEFSHIPDAIRYWVTKHAGFQTGKIRSSQASGAVTDRLQSYNVNFRKQKTSAIANRIKGYR